MRIMPPSGSRRTNRQRVGRHARILEPFLNASTYDRSRGNRIFVLRWLVAVDVVVANGKNRMCLSSRLIRGAVNPTKIFVRIRFTTSTEREKQSKRNREREREERRRFWSNDDQRVFARRSFEGRSDWEAAFIWMHVSAGNDYHVENDGDGGGGGGEWIEGRASPSSKCRLNADIVESRSAVKAIEPGSAICFPLRAGNFSPLPPLSFILPLVSLRYWNENVKTMPRPRYANRDSTCFSSLVITNPRRSPRIPFAGGIN